MSKRTTDWDCEELDLYSSIASCDLFLHFATSCKKQNVVFPLGFEISEYQKRQAAMTVRKVTKQKGEATRRYQVIFLFFSSPVCSVFSSLFTLPLTCFVCLLHSTPLWNDLWIETIGGLRNLAMSNAFSLYYFQHFFPVESNVCQPVQGGWHDLT